MDKEKRYTYHIDEYDEFDWCVVDNTTEENYVYLEDITKVLNKQNQQIIDLEAKLAESEKEIASLEVCLLENKNNMKEMQGFKIGEDEYDLTDENARNDLRNYIQEFEKVSKRIYEQKEYAEKILRMSTYEEHQEILQLKQQLAEEKNRNKKLNHEAQKYYEDAYCNNFQNQTAIAVLEEMLENEIYLNVIPDFECGDYVSSKIIKTKIEELKNGKN